MKPCDVEILTYSKRSPRILDMFGIREDDSVTISDFCSCSGVQEVREMRSSPFFGHSSKYEMALEGSARGAEDP